MKFRGQVALSLAVLISLTACGGSESPSTASGTDPFPLVVGNQWSMQYEIRIGATNASSGTLTHEVMRSEVVDGDTAHVLAESRNDSVRERRYVRTQTEVWRLPADDAPSEERAAGRFLVLKLPLLAGDRWTQLDERSDSGFDEDSDGKNELNVKHAEAVVEGVETIVTPAGSFAEAFVVTSTYSDGLVNAATNEAYEPAIRAVVREWYVLGVGVARREKLVIPAGGWREYERSEVLSGYLLTSN